MGWEHFGKHQGGTLGTDGLLWGQAMGTDHGDRPWGQAGLLMGLSTDSGGLPRPPQIPISYRTRPLVFLSTEAAKLCVTPTRLVPSTSTIRSFTWILGTGTPSGTPPRGHEIPSSRGKLFNTFPFPKTTPCKFFFFPRNISKQSIFLFCTNLSLPRCHSLFLFLDQWRESDKWPNNFIKMLKEL